MASESVALEPFAGTVIDSVCRREAEAAHGLPCRWVEVTMRHNRESTRFRDTQGRLRWVDGYAVATDTRHVSLGDLAGLYQQHPAVRRAVDRSPKLSAVQKVAVAHGGRIDAAVGGERNGVFFGASATCADGYDVTRMVFPDQHTGLSGREADIVEQQARETLAGVTHTVERVEWIGW